MLYSTRGTKIARVEGLWLVNRSNCSVSENPDNSPKVRVCSPFIVPSQNSMRDHCDIISRCHNHLLLSSSRKTTVHVHRKHSSSSVHLLASTPESPVTIDASEPLHLFLTLILCLWHSPPGILVCPHTGVLIYLHTYNKTQAGISNKQVWWKILKTIRLGK